MESVLKKFEDELGKQAISIEDPKDDARLAIQLVRIALRTAMDSSKAQEIGHAEMVSSLRDSIESRDRGDTCRISYDLANAILKRLDFKSKPVEEIYVLRHTLFRIGSSLWGGENREVYLGCMSTDALAERTLQLLTIDNGPTIKGVRER